MNNLNSNLGNKSNLNLSNNSNNSNSNSTDYFSGLSNMSLIILIAFGFIVIVFVIIVSGIYLKSYNQNKIRDHIEEELLPYIHDCKNNPKIIYGTKIPASTLGNEFSLSFWVYINGLDYRTEYDKHILFKGKQVSEKQVNPSIYIKQRTNTMVFALETTGSLSSDSKIGCYDKLDILTYNKGETSNTFDIKIDMKDKIKDYTLIESGIYNKIFLNIVKTYNALITDIFGTSKLISTGIGIKRTSDKLYEFNKNLIGSGKTFEKPETLISVGPDATKYKIERVGDKYKILLEAGNKTLCAIIKNNKNQIKSGTTTITTIIGDVSKNYNTKHTVGDLTKLKTATTFKFIDNTMLKIDKTELQKHLTTSESIVYDSIKLYKETISGVDKYYAVFPLELTIEETKFPKLDPSVKTGYYSISEPRSVNGCKSDLQKLMDNPDNSEEYKDDKYNFYGMTGSHISSGENASQNMCYSSYEAIPDNIFSKIKTDKDTKKNLYKKLEEKYCVYNNKNYGLGSPNTMFIHSMEKDTGLEEVEIKNMPLQRWVNVTLQVHNNIIDIFMDGLLHKTHIIEQGAVKPNDDNIIIGSTGGFDGYVSRIIWANKALHPGEIYEKYKEGPRISLSITDRLKNLVGMGPKEPETRNDDQTNNNKY